MEILIIFLLVIAGVSFTLYVRCTRNKHDNNYKKIVNLTKRIEELESKLHMVASDLLLTSKNQEVLI